MDKISSSVLKLAEKCLASGGNEFKIRGKELVAKYCPFCHGGDSADTDTFGISLQTGAYSCLRGNCGVKGSFRQLLEHYGEDPANYEEAKMVSISSKKKKEYVLPNEKLLKPLTDDIVTYFALRKISRETLDAFKVCSDNNGNIVFPFYRDGVLTYVKYRKPKKYVKGDGPKEWQITDTEPILFGMDNVALNKPLIITEGEIDALSVYEAGLSNVVSVPSGCNNMDWVSICWEWLENFSQIILLGDSDDPGVEMMNQLTKRLGEDRCMIAPQYPQMIVDGIDKGRVCKDANEILYAYGPEALAEVIGKCEAAPIEGVLNLSNVPCVDPMSLPRIYTRIQDLDRAVAGFGEGSLTIISGKRAEGKSTISGEFLLNAIQQGYSVAAYSGELSAYQFRQWIMSQACERKYMTYATDTRTGKKFAMVPPVIQDRISKWLDEKFFLFDNMYTESTSMIDSVLKRFTMCARRYGCKMFLVDNLMMLTSGIEEEYKMQAKITAALKQFAVRYKAVVILVAHPRKTPAGQAFGSEDIAGSAAISNLADIVMSIEKPNIRVTKNREFGDTPLIRCDFDPSTRRIYQSSIGDRTVYGWDHSGITVPENSVENDSDFAIQHGQLMEDAF